MCRIIREPVSWFLMLLAVLAAIFLIAEISFAEEGEVSVAYAMFEVNSPNIDGTMAMCTGFAARTKDGTPSLFTAGHCCQENGSVKDSVTVFRPYVESKRTRLDTTTMRIDVATDVCSVALPQTYSGPLLEISGLSTAKRETDQDFYEDSREQALLMATVPPRSPLVQLIERVALVGTERQLFFGIVQHGMSGSPILNMNKQVVGVVSTIWNKGAPFNTKGGSFILLSISCAYTGGNCVVTTY